MSACACLPELAPFLAIIYLHFDRIRSFIHTWNFYLAQPPPLYVCHSVEAIFWISLQTTDQKIPRSGLRRRRVLCPPSLWRWCQIWALLLTPVILTLEMHLQGYYKLVVTGSKHKASASKTEKYFAKLSGRNGATRKKVSSQLEWWEEETKRTWAKKKKKGVRERLSDTIISHCLHSLAVFLFLLYFCFLFTILFFKSFFLLKAYSSLIVLFLLI